MASVFYVSSATVKDRLPDGYHNVSSASNEWPILTSPNLILINSISSNHSNFTEEI